MPDRRWELLERARPRLHTAFTDRGVTKVDYIANFDNLTVVAETQETIDRDFESGWF